MKFIRNVLSMNRNTCFNLNNIVDYLLSKVLFVWEWGMCYLKI